MTKIYIGTSGWHYNDWFGRFYPREVKGYKELQYHARYFNTVENNSSFYRVASENAYKTWDRMTPDGYIFSLKLNRYITHIRRLTLNDEVRERVRYILQTTQVLGSKLGALLIQLPPSLRYDIEKLEKFLKFITKEVQKQEYKFDFAIGFRNKYWFVGEVYELLEKYNIALVASQSSRYPEEKHLTADFAYIRMHGPKRLFASKYSKAQLVEWANYITKIEPKVDRIYAYFNNDFHGHAIKNAQELQKLLHI